VCVCACACVCVRVCVFLKGQKRLSFRGFSLSVLSKLDRTVVFRSLSSFSKQRRRQRRRRRGHGRGHFSNEEKRREKRQEEGQRNGAKRRSYGEEADFAFGRRFFHRSLFSFETTPSCSLSTPPNKRPALFCRHDTSPREQRRACRAREEGGERDEGFVFSLPLRCASGQTLFFLLSSRRKLSFALWLSLCGPFSTSPRTWSEESWERKSGLREAGEHRGRGGVMSVFFFSSVRKVRAFVVVEKVSTSS